ncbi:MAG: hypothetical protein GC190_17715 [Alphaproteobacteria bacterium]|nr:hypothetical protein [Alphaproteobacteria bacterium]
MLLRLLAFAFFVAALGTLGGDAWASFTSGSPFHLRNLEEWWQLASPWTLDWVKSAWSGVTAILPFPAPAILAALGAITLLPTIFFRQRH